MEMEIAKASKVPTHMSDEIGLCKEDHSNKRHCTVFENEGKHGICVVLNRFVYM